MSGTGELKCFFDMDPFAAECDDAAEELLDTCAHVLEQDLGTNLDDPDSGVGLAGMTSKPLPPGLEQTAKTMLENIDDVTSADCKLTLEDATPITAIGNMAVTIFADGLTLDALDLVVGVGTTGEDAA